MEEAEIPDLFDVTCLTFGPDAKLLWRGPLLGFLSDVLEEHEPADPVAALLLAALAHLPLSPSCGIDFAVFRIELSAFVWELPLPANIKIVEELCGYLKSVSFPEICVDVPGTAVELLQKLEWRRCTTSSSELVDEDGGATRNNEFATIWYHLQRAESKDFENDEEEDSATDCGEANNKSTIKYSSLKILYNKLFGTVPADEFCELELFALALSVFSRLADSAVNAETVIAWKLMLRLLLGGSLNFLADEVTQSSGFAYQRSRKEVQNETLLRGYLLMALKNESGCRSTMTKERGKLPRKNHA
ncbi:unnamed protein product [Gongylonema pulchrum]|uniref:Uncharacterized protein n=1 Tax=Gongylonema pulchrum TaxID=637853 RepID=A0A183EDZ3_9BILA|nr:unnamed protein product [Gongylonema pulchrum]